MMNNILVWFILLIVCVVSANSLTCYYCANCPVPFNPYSSAVSKVQSPTRFCAKKSTSAFPGAPASRGPANPGLCSRTGCGWTYEAGQSVYACCCTSSYCNTGSVTSKSTITVLFGTLAVLVVNRYL